MRQRSEVVDLAICCALIFLALLGFISYFTSGLLRGDIDGCFLTGGVFSALLLLIVRSAGWFKLFAAKRMKKATPAAGLDQLQTARVTQNMGARLK